MTIRAPLIALCTLLVACGENRPIQQTTVTQLREQRSLVTAPEAPMGFGASLPAGAAGLSFGGAFTAAGQPGEGEPGEHVLPLSALLRGAVAAGEGVEFTASGSLASPDVDAGPIAPGVDDRSGVLGRGMLGMRTFLPMKGLVEWGWAFDLGAEATHVSRTDTVTTDVRDRDGTASTVSASTIHDLKVHPHTRVATMLRVPTPLPFTAVGGFQLQTWPAYWASRTRTETCTVWRGGEQQCDHSGSVNGPASHLVVVFTPTLGATIDAGSTAIHLQAFTHIGDTAVQNVPWGAMVMLEQVMLPSASDD